MAARWGGACAIRSDGGEAGRASPPSMAPEERGCTAPGGEKRREEEEGTPPDFERLSRLAVQRETWIVEIGGLSYSKTNQKQVV